jgi:xylan 1,4-beta-xylosidase
MTAYRAMGSPRYPTKAQIAELNKASTLPPPEKGNLKDSTLALNLPVNGLAVIELPAR